MKRKDLRRVVGVMALVVAASSPVVVAADEPLVEQHSTRWHDQYSLAWQQAKQSRQMLLIHFLPEQPSEPSHALSKSLGSDPATIASLHDFVLVRLPVDAVIQVDGKPVKLIEHEAFSAMQGHAGIAIVDLAHEGQPYYGHVVSAFPLRKGKYYQFQTAYLPVILQLPPGTITQRTMVWAVRIHPEEPASTSGESSDILATKASEHSHHQARIRLQGHHGWDARFQRIRKLLGRPSAVEVVAESWPDQTLLDSCIDCVASWRQSSGHWEAVSRHHAVYGYDICRSSNGIWYGTGIFAN